MPLRALVILSICVIACLASLRKPFWGLCFFALITYIRPERFSYDYLGQFHIPLILSICILIGWLLNRKEIKNPLKHSMIIVSLFGLAITQIITSFFAVYSTKLSLDYALVTLKIAIFCFLMTQLIDSREKLKYFIIVNLIGGSFIAIWGIQQHFLGNVRLENMAGGQFGESNSCATLWLLLIPIFFIMVINGTNKIRFIGAVMTAMFSTAIVFSESRAATAGLIVAFIFILFKLPWKQRAICLIVCLFLYPMLRYAALDVRNYDERFESIALYETIEGRVMIWKAGMILFQDHPFTGVGQQNFQYLSKNLFEKLGFQVTSWERLDVHNTPLLILYEGGVFSFFFYLLAILLYFKDSIKLKKTFLKNSDFKKYILVVAALNAGMIGYFISAMSHSYAIFETVYWFIVIPSIMKNLYIKEIGKRKLAEVMANSTMSI